MDSRRNSTAGQQGACATKSRLLACFLTAICLYGCVVLAAIHRTSLPIQSHMQEMVSRKLMMQQSSGKSKLLLVQAYVCEGARTPYTNQHLPSLQWRNCPEYQYEFPAVSISNNSRAQESPTISTPLPGGCRRGVLTSTGYQASYEVGAYLRAQYVAHYRLLSPSYQPNSLQASSSSSQASFDSLQGVLAGLYPNIDSVVPVTTAGSDAEGIADAECPALDRFLKRLKLMQMSQDAHDSRQQELVARVHKLVMELNSTISSTAAAARAVAASIIGPSGLPSPLSSPSVRGRSFTGAAAASSSPATADGEGSSMLGTRTSTFDDSISNNASDIVDLQDSLLELNHSHKHGRRLSGLEVLTPSRTHNGHIFKQGTAEPENMSSRRSSSTSQTLSSAPATTLNWNNLFEEVSCIAASSESAVAEAAQQILALMQPHVLRGKLDIMTACGSSCLVSPEDCARVLQLGIGLQLDSILQQWRAAVTARNATGMAGDKTEVTGRAAGRHSLAGHGQPAVGINSSSCGAVGYSTLCAEQPQQTKLQQRLNETPDQPSSNDARQQLTSAATTNCTRNASSQQQQLQQQQHKLFLHSVEDTTLVMLLHALEVEITQWPGFSSHLEFELWQHAAADRDHYFVRVMYQGQPIMFSKAGSQLHASLSSSASGSWLHNSHYTDSYFDTGFGSSIGSGFGRSAALPVVALQDLESLAFAPLALTQQEYATSCSTAAASAATSTE